MFTNKKIKTLETEIIRLKQELLEAKNLKTVLDKLSDKVFAFNEYSIGAASCINNISVADLPKNVAVYEEDLLTKKQIIKQEAHKAILIDKDGNIKTGITLSKKDAGYNYSLVRQK